MRAAAAAMLLACALAHAAEPGPDSPELRIGLAAEDAWRGSAALVGQTIERLRAELPEYRVSVSTLPSDALAAAAETQRIDLLAAGPAVYRRLTLRGAHSLAAVTSPRAPDPNYGDASLIIAAGGESSPGTVASLSGKTVAVSPRFGFPGYEYALGEISRLGFSRHFLGGVLRVEGSTGELLAALREGRADAAVLPACLLEEHSERTGEDTSWIRVVGSRQHAALRCLHSTDLYPGLTLAVLPTTTPEEIRRIQRALSQMNPVGGYGWSFPTDFRSTDRLLSALELDEFSIYRRSFLHDFWGRFGKTISIGLLALLVLALHSFIVSHQVRRRTRELQEALEEQTRLRSTAQAAATRIEKLQKLGAMGQMSSLFAHELRQPLSSIITYAFSLARRNSKLYADARLEEGLSEIRAQAERADEIVKRVRSYIKSRSSSAVTADWTEIIRGTIREFHSVSDKRLAVRFDPPGPVWIHADPLEMELVVLNLLRNASEAQEGSDSAEVRITVAAGGPEATLIMEDNGPRLTEESLRRIGDPLGSDKPEGLGLGLSIVRALLEKHAGRIAFAPGDPTGLRVTVTLPAAPAPGAPTETEIPR